MRCSLFLLLVLIVYSTASTAQCTGAKVVSPLVAEPTATSIVSATCSTMVVRWQGSPGQSYSVTASRYNPSTNVRDTVAGSAAVCNGTSSCTSTLAVVAGTKVTWSVQASSVINGSIFYSYPAEGAPVDYPILACGVAPNTVILSGKVFLQGAYNTATSAMNNTLNTTGILQANAASQPYNITGFNYPGTESVGAGFFAAHSDIVDWVLLELRDAIVSPSIIARRAAFVRQNGSLVDIDGTSSVITFNNMDPGNYFVSIQHRNHLAVRTLAPVNFNTGSATYDFTNSLSNAYAGTVANTPVALINPGVFGLWAGNANEDITVKMTGINFNNNDYLKLLNVLGNSTNQQTNVYSRQDLNMDGTVRMTGFSPANNDYLKLVNLLGSSVVSVSQPIF
jgi:hypothetical protein